MGWKMVYNFLGIDEKIKRNLLTFDQNVRTVYSNINTVYCNTRGYYCYLSIKTRCVGFRLHTSTCVFPSINILPVNIKLLIKLFQVVR